MPATLVPANLLDEASRILTESRLQQPDYWHYWDSEPLTAVATLGPFFTNVSTKNFYQTNLRQTPLPRPQVFTIESIAFMIDGDANTAGVVADNLLTSIISLLEDSRVDFFVGNKNHLECQLPSLPGGGGIVLTADQDVAAAPSIDAGLTMGPPSPAYQIKLPWEIRIVHGEAFEMRLEWGHVIDVGGFPANPRLFCFLEGILDRGVSA